MDGRRVTNDTDFADWIRPHLGMLSRISRAFAAPADQHDLLQELLLTAWKARPSFRADSSAATFLYRVGHNRALTWKRREGLRALRLFEARHEIAAAEADTNRQPEERQLQALYAAIRQLPPIDRSLVLSSLEGVSYADMAALHGLSESNIGARLTRTRARLVGLAAEMSDGL